MADYYSILARAVSRLETMLRFAKNCTSTREQFLMLISTEATHKYQH